MTISRQIFNIATNQIAAGDTGPAFSGEVDQIRWYPHIPGSHALEVSLLSQLGDTGQYGFRFLNTSPGVLASQQVYFPRMYPHNVNGQPDTGFTAVPVVADNGHIRVKIMDTGTTSTAGRLEVWTKDCQ